MISAHLRLVFLHAIFSAKNSHSYFSSAQYLESKPAPRTCLAGHSLSLIGNFLK
jgi:hypothetical protein